MDFSKRLPALLYLDRNGFYFYQEGLSSIISLAFAADTVKDMDVINSASLMAQIKAFTEQYRLVPSMITIVTSPNVTFEKEFVGLAKEAQDEAVKHFIETIPFESVLTKSYPIDKGVKIIGANEDLYLQLKLCFEKNNFIVGMVIPYQLLGSDQTLIKNLTTDNATQFIRRVDHLRQQSLILPDKDKAVTPTTTPATEKPTEKPKKNNTRLFGMIGVFALLFIILGYMLFNMK